MTQTMSTQQPIKHTAVRHRALATVADDRVRYDRSSATWRLLDDARASERGSSTLAGSVQRTLRDLLDRGLIERWSPSGDGTVSLVGLSERGRSALSLWGETDERLNGPDGE